MKCPKCGGALDEGNLGCVSCGATFELVERQARVVEVPSDYVQVMRIEDPAVGAVVVSLLEAEGIPVIVVNDKSQDLIGLGRFAMGYNPLLGPALAYVERKNEEAARALIAQQRPLDAAPPGGEGEASR